MGCRGAEPIDKERRYPKNLHLCMRGSLYRITFIRNERFSYQLDKLRTPIAQNQKDIPFAGFHSRLDNRKANKQAGTDKVLVIYSSLSTPLDLNYNNQN